MRRITQLALLAMVPALSACGPKPKDAAKDSPPPEQEGALMRVGSLTIYQSDLDYQLKDGHGGHGDAAICQRALDELTDRARCSQAALDAGLDRDPAVRADIARVLEGRLKETTLAPRLKELTAAVPEARRREIYAAEAARFHSNEKRRVAVLWLNPNGNPQHEKQYVDKLATARDWLDKNSDLKGHPDQGFGVLGVDYSEHQASRYKGGVVGWLERDGGADRWTKALAEIAYSLDAAGQVSTVISRPEGVFLVRLMEIQAAVQRPFASVTSELETLERQRLRQHAETEFESRIAAKVTVHTLGQPAPDRK